MAVLLEFLAAAVKTKLTIQQRSSAQRS